MDYLYCTDKASFDSWILAHCDDCDYIHVDLAELLNKRHEIYPIEFSHTDARGTDVYVRDSARTDHLVLAVIHDEDFAAEVAALPYITVHRDITAAGIAAIYPDHAAFNNAISYIAE